jgi:hypothetical protein
MKTVRHKGDRLNWAFANNAQTFSLSESNSKGKKVVVKSESIPTNPQKNQTKLLVP